MIPAPFYNKIKKVLPILCVDGLIVNEKGEYLLVRRMNQPLKGRWYVPGGRLLKGEKLKDAIYRKMLEELSIWVKNPEYVGYYEDFFPELHTVSAVFRCHLDSRIPIVLDSQASNYKWSKTLPKRFKIKTL